MLSLKEQIEYVEYHLLEFVKFLRGTNETGDAPKIIIISHSVGSYIGLEILRRWRERIGKKGADTEPQIVGYISLWPTVTWISKSNSGKKMGVGRATSGPCRLG